MKTLFRFVFIAIGAALSFAIIAVIAFIVFFDANVYKDDLSQLVKNETGRELVFIGDVSLTFYPELGMKLGAMTFSNPPGFGQLPMAKVGEASVSVNVASLFKMQPEIDQFVLRGLEVNLLTLADGANNWDDLTAAPAPAEQTSAASAAQPSAAAPAAESTPMNIEGAFAGLLIENARVRYENQQTGAVYDLKDFDLTTGRITPDDPFPITLQAVVSSEGQLDARINLDAGFQYLFETGVVSIRDVTFSTSAVGPLIPLDDVAVEMQTAALDFDTGAGQLSINNLDLRTRANGVLPDLDDVTVEVKTTSLGFDTANSQLRMAGLNIGTVANGSLLPLGTISTTVGSESLALDLNERSLLIDDLVLAVDNTRFTGNLNVIDYAQPAVAFRLNTDNLDVDALLGTPPPQPPAEDAATTEEPAPVETGSAEDVQIALPEELMRALFIDGELTAGNVKVQNVRMNDVQVAIKADQGVVQLQPLGLKMYQGEYNGGITIDVRGEQPVYRVQQDLQGVQVGDLLNDFMLLDKIGGEMNASIDLRTRGDWVSELKRNSNGNIGLNFRDGALKGFNLRHSIDVAKARFDGEEPPVLENQQTDFSALGISGVVNNGVFSSDDLNLQAPAIRVGGQGSADLNVNTVDYLVTAKVVATSKGQDAGTVDDRSGLLIPVKITGPFTAPDIDVQYDEFIKGQLDAEKQRLAAEVEKQKQALQAQIDEERRKLEAARQEQQRLAAEKAKAEAAAKAAEEQRKLQERIEAEKRKAEEKLKNLLN